MTDIRATAPGKLVLVGEYAVLQGAPALATAIGIRATAHLTELAGDSNELHVANSGKTFRFAQGPHARIEWQQDPGSEGTILAAAMETLHAMGGEPESPGSHRLVLDSRGFFQNPDGSGQVKLGLGSSAAVCVAVTAALMKRNGARPDYDTVLAAHRHLQRGRGSGIDVAASFYGGVVEFSSQPGNQARVRQLSWPQGLFALPVWTGQSASTPAMLEHLDDFRRRAPDEYQRLASELSAASAYAVAQWDAGRAEVVLAALQDFSDHLRALDNAAGIGIWSDQHRRLGEMAAEHDAVYKPSGAGGGDFGLAFAGSDARLQKLRRVYTEAGFLVPELELGVGGLEITP